MVARPRLLSIPRVVSHLLPLAALLSLPGAAPAQQDTVQRETGRRLAMAQEADSLAAEGDAARAAGKTAEAVNRYSAALDRIAPGSPALAAQRQSVVNRFAETSVAYARELAERGDLEKAKVTLQAVLDERAAPGYAPAKTLLGQLDDPDRFNPAQSPRHARDTKKIRDLFVLAQGNLDIADYKAAREAFNQILAVDETNTAARRGLEQIEKRINDHLRSERDYTRAKMLNTVDQQWETAVPSGLNPKSARGPGEIPAATNETTSARLKMQGITLDRVAMSDTPLQEALTYLARKSVELDTAEPDPNLKGVNIVFNPAGKAPGDFKTITLDLRNQSLGDALRAITDQTQTRFSTEGNTVTVAPLGVGSRIVTRTFRVPPGFLSRTGSASADAGAVSDPFASGGNANVSSGLKISRTSAKDWLAQNGVPFPEGTTADYSAGSNTLIVRNTEENLELVQTAVDSTTDKAQRQVKVQVVLLKAENRRLQELGYDWMIGPASVGGGVYAAGGTVGNATTAPKPADIPFQAPGGRGPIGSNPVTSGLRSAFDLQSGSSIDNLIASGTAGAAITNTRSPAILSTAGVFTSPQFQGILRGLNQKKGIDLSVGQTVILKAGQRATAASQRTIRVPTEFDPPQIPQSVVPPLNFDPVTGVIGQGSVGQPPVTPTTPNSFEDRETGSKIEVEATVGEDGSTVDLNLSVQFRELDGFIDFGTPITSGGSVLTPNQILIPVFSKIEESAQFQIYDGATVTIGGLSDARYETIHDKVPILGDIPFLGRFFRSDVNQVTQKAVIYYVTVQVIDPGGMGIQEAAAAAEQATAPVPDP